MGKNRKGGSSDSFEKVLTGKRQELLRRIEQQRAQLNNNEHEPDDEAALAVGSVEKELAMANLDRDTRTLAEVEAALRSLESGTYGICVRCEEAISDARLRALPWTRLCLECAAGGVRQVPDTRSAPRPRVLGTLEMAGTLRSRARAK